MSGIHTVTTMPTRKDLEQITGWERARVIWRGPRGLVAYAFPSTSYRDRGRYLGVFDMSEDLQREVPAT